MKGYIHSLQSLGTVDGPGVRAVVFASGCPLRCAYCHNPDTWRMDEGEPTEVTQLYERIKRLYPYIKNGGVTFSGGEPCMQAEFFTELARLLRADGIHVALDTSCSVMNPQVRELIGQCDLVISDLKFTSEQDYLRYTGGSLTDTLDFIKYLSSEGKEIWIRQVITPGVNDGRENISRLNDILAGVEGVTRVELLPFRKLCLEKYKNLGIPFPFEDKPEMSKQALKELEGLLNKRDMP